MPPLHRRFYYHPFSPKLEALSNNLFLCELRQLLRFPDGDPLVLLRPCLDHPEKRLHVANLPKAQLLHALAERLTIDGSVAYLDSPLLYIQAQSEVDSHVLPPMNIFALLGTDVSVPKSL